MSLGLLTLAASLLALERVCYVWIARAPRTFRRWCERPLVAHLGEPVAVVRMLFVAFKILQLAIFAGWCVVHADGQLVPAPPGPAALGVATVFIAVGQTLNLLVFYRLGRVAVFFGHRLGHDVAWCQEFPFSVLRHPQYVGAVLSIWGFFLAARFPHDDWYLLPVLETAYYAIGATLEVSEAPERDEVMA